jgi:hypothetical protein
MVSVYVMCEERLLVATLPSNSPVLARKRHTCDRL